MTKNAVHCRDVDPTAPVATVAKKPVVRYSDEMESRKSVARWLVYFILGILLGFFLVAAASRSHVERHDLYDTPKRRAVEQIPSTTGSVSLENLYTDSDRVARP